MYRVTPNPNPEPKGSSLGYISFTPMPRLLFQLLTVNLADLPMLPIVCSHSQRRLIYKEHTSTHAQGTDPRVALGA